MKRRAIRRLCFLLAPIAIAGCSDDLVAPAADLAPAMSQAAAEVGGRYIVVFRSSSGEPARFREELARAGGAIEHAMPEVGAAIVSNLSPAGAAALARGAGVQSVDLSPAIPFRATRVALPGAVTEVPDAELASPSAPQTAGLFPYQWNLRAISAPQAWLAGHRGSSAVKVAILDTGIDEGLPFGGVRRNIDLEGLIDRQRSRSFIPAEDAITSTLFPGAPLWTDLDGHGTNVASQVSSNAINFAGVTSQARLIAVKVCTVLPPPATPANPDPDPGYCDGAAVFAGLVYAVDAGADVINMSLGVGFPKRSCPGCTSLFNRLMQYAFQNGVTVVVAAGNNALDLDHAKNLYMTYCDVPHVICVSATGAVASGPALLGPFVTPDEPALYSNFGRSAIDLAAPGGNYTLGLIGEGEEAEIGIVDAAYVLSLCPRRTAAGYDEEDKDVKPLGPCGIVGYLGTSQAAPHVAGLAAMLVPKLGRNPDLIREHIAATADQLGASGNDPRYGKGRINVARAMSAF